MDSQIIGTCSQSLWSHTKLDTAAACVLATLVLTQRLWYRYLPISDNIPEEFWHQVPQESSDHQAVTDDEKNKLRDIRHVFSEQVSTSCAVMPSLSTHALAQKLDMVIFWGSQSGRGEMLARRLAKGLYDRFRLRVLTADLDNHDHRHLAQLEKHQLCGFVLSTYGDGDPPDNTNGLWNMLHKLSVNGTALENLRYIIFGLGNSNYRQFNRVAEHVDNSLEKMGATRYGEAGRCDDANGDTENTFASWR